MPYLVATSAVRDWVNSLPIVGPGNPLALGAYVEPPRSPGTGGYALLSRIGGAGGGLVAEETVDSPRISATILAGTFEAAEAAAVAYANAVDSLRGVRAAMGETLCLVADNITGPLYVDLHSSTREQFQWLLDADFYLI